MATATTSAGRAKKPPRSPQIITDVDEAIRLLTPCQEIGLDLETGGLDPFHDPVAVVSLKGDNGVIAILHVRGRIPDSLKAFLSEPGRVYIGHNITAFDLPFLYSNGVDVKRWFDTLTVESLLDTQNRRDRSRSLKATVARRLGKDVPKSIGEHSWMKPTLTPEELAYCVDDVEFLIPLKQEHIKKAGDTGQINALKLELQIAPAVTRMTCNGLPANRERLQAYLEKQNLEAIRTLELLHAAFEPLNIPLPKKQTTINLDSPAQLKAVYAAMGYPILKTDKETLTEIATHHEVPEVRAITRTLLEYKYARQRQKVYGEWLEPGNRFYSDGYVRAKFWQSGTGTGRFSSSEPNLQQIPKDMREVFGWLTGYKIVSVDYAAIEVRVAAAQAKDIVLLRALMDEDIHRTVASIVFGKPRHEISKDERQQAKAAVFCLIFGGGAATLQRYARMYGQELTLDQCKQIVANFFARFTGLREMRSRAYRQADNANGTPLTVRLPHGLKRVLVGNEATATRLLNTAVQGTAAAGMKYALLLAHQAGLTRYIGATVHDELVAVVPEDEANDFGAALSDCMIEGMYRVVPREVMIGGETIPVPIVTGDEKGRFTVDNYWAK
jgi:DNA polymerase I